METITSYNIWTITDEREAEMAWPTYQEEYTAMMDDMAEEEAMNEIYGLYDQRTATTEETYYNAGEIV